MTPPAVNVASHLARLAAAAPDRPALQVPVRGVRPGGPSAHRAVTYAQLNADADALAHGLALAGVGRGARVAVLVPPGPDFFALTFALLKASAVPVLIDPGMGVKGLGRCLAEAEPGAFVGTPKAHLARRAFGWAKRTVKVTVSTGRRFFCDHTLAGLRDRGRPRGRFAGPDVSPTEPAAVLFTSGSTGPARGAVYTHGTFAAQVDVIREVYGIADGEVDLCTFPLFALFGPALGMTSVLPDMDPTRPARLDPRKAAAQVKQFGVTNLFGSPAVVRRLGELAGDDAASLATLRRVVSAGAPATLAAVERLAKLLPAGAEVFTPYGATEALPVANVGSRELLGETRHLTEAGKGVCVGRPVPGVEVAVIPVTDDPVKEWDDALRLPPGEVGEFAVRGPVVTRQYHNRPNATRLAKFRDPRTGDVWHRMGDAGYLDDRGRLWFCGRKSHRVVTPHGTLFTEQVEPVFDTVPGVARTALVGVTRGGVVHPVLCVEPVPAWEFLDPAAKVRPPAWAAVAEALRSAGAGHEHTARIQTFLPHPGPFPTDRRHNSKIAREALARWADRKLGPKWHPGAKP